MRYDVVIAGAGLAGACAALHLSRTHRVLLMEAAAPAAGASGAAAGLVNPLMGRRARPVWQHPAALAAFHDTLRLADAGHLLRGPGLLRPAADEKQARAFRETAAQHPDLCAWWPAAVAREACPYLGRQAGVLRIHAGGALAVPVLVAALVAAAQRHGARVDTGVRITGWEEKNGEVAVRHTAAPDPVRAGKLLLALGAGYRAFPELAALRLHAVKGQVVRVARPPGLSAVPPLSGRGYLVPDGETLLLGSTYEHDFSDIAPTPEATQEVLEKTTRLLPALREAEVVEAIAGVRVTVPGTRLPMLGPLPHRENVWIFTGLGSKGLLMAPLLAQNLPGYLADPSRLPVEVH